MPGLLFAAMLAWAAPGEAPRVAAEDPWQTRLPAFSVDAPPRGEAPILLYFSAPWCGFCKQMERTTLADAEVIAQVARMRAHKIDYDSQGGLVERFSVRGIPAFVLTNDRGEVIDRLTGAAPKEEFLKWLASGKAAATRAAQGSEERAAILNTIVRGLISFDDETRTRAQAACWDLAGRGDEAERKEALAALRAVLGDSGLAEKKKRLIWLAGLGHADLAVRAAAANLLRTLAPEGAKLYDPWADAPARAEALERIFGR